MDCKTKIKELREMTGMNRKDFCKFFHIPYRTVTEWELDNRHAPEYVLRLLEYYIRNEGLIKSPAEQKHAGERSGLLSKIYDDPKYNAAFDRCIDVMTKLMLKYGNQVLERHQMAAPVSLQEQPGTEQSSSFADAA